MSEWTPVEHREQVEVRRAVDGETVSTLSGPIHTNPGDYVIRRRMSEDQPWDERVGDHDSLSYHFDLSDVPDPEVEKDEDDDQEDDQEDESLTVDPDDHKLGELQDKARAAGLSTTGNKAELAERLTEHYQQQGHASV